MKRLKNSMLMSVLTLVLASCTAREAKQVEEVEATTAEIEAAQMAGREAARRFMSYEWKDSLDLHRQMLEVAAQRSEYSSAHRIAERNAFDSTFISTVRTVRPGLANEIERQRPRD